MSASTSTIHGAQGTRNVRAASLAGVLGLALAAAVAVGALSAARSQSAPAPAPAATWDHGTSLDASGLAPATWDHGTSLGSTGPTSIAIATDQMAKANSIGKSGVGVATSVATATDPMAKANSIGKSGVGASTGSTASHGTSSQYRQLPR